MCLPEAISVESKANKMAEVASRSFSADSGFLFSDSDLLTHFDSFRCYGIALGKL